MLPRQREAFFQRGEEGGGKDNIGDAVQRSVKEKNPMKTAFFENNIIMWGD